MPVLLTAMAVTDEIHVYSRYFALLCLKPKDDHRNLVKETMAEMVCPVVNTSLTTAIGFVSFAFSPLKPVVAFGIFTAIGVVFCLFWSLSVMPALLALINPVRLRPAARAGKVALEHGSAPFFTRFARSAVQFRFWILGGLVPILVLAPLGLRRLVVQDSWIDGFDPSSEFSQTTRLVNEQYHGMHLLQVSLAAGQRARGPLQVSDITFPKFSLPTNICSRPEDLLGSWLYISIEPALAGQPRTSWRSTIESAYLQVDRIQATTQHREADSEVWRRLSRATNIQFETIPQPFLLPGTMKAVAEFGAFVETQKDCKVGKVLSAPDLVATTRFMIRPNDPGARVVPDTPSEIKLMWDYYRIVRGPEQFASGGRHQLRQLTPDNFPEGRKFRRHRKTHA